MQNDSAVFKGDKDRRDYLAELHSHLVEGDPTDALLLVEQKTLGLRNRNGDRIGLSIRNHDALAVNNWHDLWRSMAIPLTGNSSATAISLDMSWPGHFGREPNEDCELEPVIETNYFNDGVFPFSVTSRDEFQLACEYQHSPWRGAFDEIDGNLTIAGLSELYGRVQLQAAVANRTPEEEDAYQLNAALAAIGVHIATKRTIVAEGLPKPMAVLVGSNEDFPFFIAPVVTFEESNDFVRSTPKAETEKKAKATRPENLDSHENASVKEEGAFDDETSNKREQNRQRAEQWADQMTDRVADSIKSTIKQPATRKAIASVGSLALNIANSASKSNAQKRAIRELNKIFKKL